LRQTLASLVSQSHRHWEAVVVDDHSQDPHRTQQAQACATDERIRLIPSPADRRGAAAARNVGLEAARGDYALFLDSDDLLDPGCLIGRLDRLEADPQLGFVVSGARLFTKRPFDSDRRFNWAYPEPDLDRFLTLDYPWQTSGPLWRSEVVRQLGGWDETLPSWQDVDLHVRALAARVPYLVNLHPDYHYRHAEALPAGEHPRFGCQATSVGHILRRRPVLRRWATLMRQHGHVGTSAWNRLAGLHLNLAESLVDHGKRCRAAQLWHAARKSRVVTPAQYAAGLALLWMRQTENHLQSPLEKRIRGHWLSDFEFRWSKTFMASPPTPTESLPMHRPNVLRPSRLRDAS
jgi:GT2 family glycosyltransferase